MPETKPTDLMEWATAVDADIVEPTLDEKQTGWVTGQAPPAPYFNYWKRGIYRWVRWLNDLANQAFTWTGAHVFSGAVTISAGISAAFSGALSAASLTLSGALTAATGAFTGALTAASLTLTGALGAASAVFSGALSAASGAFSGAVTVGATLGVTGNTTIGGTLVSTGKVTANGGLEMNGAMTSSDGNIALTGNLQVSSGWFYTPNDHIHSGSYIQADSYFTGQRVVLSQNGGQTASLASNVYKDSICKAWGVFWPDPGPSQTLRGACGVTGASAPGDGDLGVTLATSLTGAAEFAVVITNNDANYVFGSSDWQSTNYFEIAAFSPGSGGVDAHAFGWNFVVFGRNS